MNEENTLRLIVIAVTIFVFVITITMIVIYYNAAVDVAEASLLATVDFADVYNDKLEEIEHKEIKGTELINIIKNIAKEKKVTINPINLPPIGGIYDFNNDIRLENNGNRRESDLYAGGFITKSDNYYISDLQIFDDEVIFDIKKVATW